MRGALLCVEYIPGILRITPAHAGSIRHRYCQRGQWQDHPRACGEHIEKFCKPSQGGSPPRMRGALSANLDIYACPRITPAHAGSIFANLYVCEIGGDHPRACGEHFVRNLLIGHPLGSPPRMRGAFLVSILESRICRITPAHAGSILPV